MPKRRTRGRIGGLAGGLAPAYRNAKRTISILLVTVVFHVDHKANIKHKSMLEVEHLCLQFQCELQCHHETLVAQRVHKLEILNRKIALECARAGGAMDNINNINPIFH